MKLIENRQDVNTGLHTQSHLRQRGKSGLKVELFGGKGFIFLFTLCANKIKSRSARLQTNIHASFPLRCQGSRRDKVSMY